MPVKVKTEELWPALAAEQRDPLCAAVGSVLRDLRLRRGLSMYELARRARVAKQTVRFVESGPGGLMLTTIDRLCRVLHVLPSEVLLLAEPLCVRLD